MPICIVAATQLELQSCNTSNCNVLITGIGTAATVYHLTNYLHLNKPSLLIQVGIAGSFGEDLQPGSAVVISADRFADLGVQENSQWRDVFDMQLTEPNELPYSNGWLINPHQQLLNSTALPQVKGITINEITTSPNRISQLRHKYSPSIESMEGAALHYVCLQQNIPFIQLRTISNYVGERNKEKWQMKAAIQNLSAPLVQILEAAGL
jgi:futalosine hydrolase